MSDQSSNADGAVASSESPSAESNHADVQFENLKEGFCSLQVGGKGISPGGTNINDNNGVSSKLSNSFVSVNFIDPSSATGPSPKYGKPPQAPLELYEKLTSTFERDYGSTLHSVPYQNIRSGGNAVIERLPVKPVLTRSHGGTSANGDAMVPWGGTAGTAAAPVSDPAEWHNGPYCHVYIAACESIQHYRAKVRPSLQAFVSQIEGAANNAHPLDPNNAAASGNYSAHYIIVFVPTGPKSGTDASIENASTANRMGAVLANRISAAKKRMANAANAAQREREFSNDISLNSVATTNSETTGDIDDVSEQSVASSESTLSKQDKELYRKFSSDFPNGTTCILSTLLDSDASDDGVPKYSAQRTQEWNLFTRALGSAIVDGFRDRCRRYHEELRRLDSRRAGLPITSSSKRSVVPSQAFDLSHFFLVKESLAFTYEQMQLPSEALLQYEELRAFVPDASEGTPTSAAAKRKSSSDGQSAMDLAVSGDTQGFRRRIRATTDMVPIAHIVITYLFSREVFLLFKMVQPVEVVKRCQVYAETIYSFLLDNGGKSDLSKDELHQNCIEAEQWALCFSWDVKCAAQSYFSLLDNWMNSASSVDALSPTTSSGRGTGSASPSKRSSPASSASDPADAKALAIEQALARQLNELLEFARLRLMRLGDMELGDNNPIRSRRKGIPDDMKSAWLPWTSNKDNQESKNSNETSDFTMFSSMQETNRPFIENEEERFPTEDSFTSKYMELTSSIAAVGFFAGRHRHGARLLGEIADILVKRGDYTAAIRALLPTVNVLAKDHWHRCHFWYLFRLASCQRRVGKPSEYLKTLVNCFGPNILPVAPPKALDSLLNDLEAVASDDSLVSSDSKSARFSMVPFLGTRLEVEKTSSGESSSVLGPERKQLQKKVCMVGDDVRINLHVSSYLPRSIELDVVSVSLVTFENYAPKIEENATLSKKDIFKVLTNESQENKSLDPGLNKFVFDWIAVQPGQYILASIEMRWKGVSFCFDTSEHRRPLVGIDVLPSDPTQSIKLEPSYLVPGHVQPVRIIYKSGADVIQNGSVRLNCSSGLEIIPPGANAEDNNWKNAFEMRLPPCRQGETTVLNATARVSKFSSVLRAEVSTNYRHAKLVEENDKNKDDTGGVKKNEGSMKTILEATLPALDKPALSVIETNALFYSDDGVLVNISLMCNAPVPFLITKWRLNAPPPLFIEEDENGAGGDGDLNSSLFESPVVGGEEVSFSFSCKLAPMEDIIGNNDAEAPQELEKPVLEIQLQDEYGSVFDEKLSLNLRAFYSQALGVPRPVGHDSIVVQLKNYLTEGAVGSPVILTYIIDNSSLQKLKETVLSEINSNDDGSDASAKIKPGDDVKFLYSVDYNEKDWVIGGNVQGSVDVDEKDESSIELIAIPTREGLIKGFPAISLSYIKGGSDTNLPISVQTQREPEMFDSLAFTAHTAVACPTSGFQRK